MTYAKAWPLTLRFKAWAVEFGWFPGFLHARWDAEVHKRLLTDIFGPSSDPSSPLNLEGRDA